MKAKSLLAALITVFAFPSPIRATDATELLERANAAGRNVSYRGIKRAQVYFGGNMATSILKIVHLKPDKTRTEYFLPQMLAGTVFIHDGPDCWRYTPREDLWEHVRVCGMADSHMICREALRNYEIHLAGTERIAGRTTYLINATPKIPSEPTRRIWVDSEYYLILGTQVDNPLGYIVNSSRFQSIEVNPTDINPSVFKVEGRSETSAKDPSVKFAILKPSYLPKGYKLTAASAIKLKNRSCVHLQFSNGANVISLFEHESSTESPATRVKSRQHNNVLTWARGGMRFTLMGDISRSELRKIAASIK